MSCWARLWEMSSLLWFGLGPSGFLAVTQQTHGLGRI